MGQFLNEANGYLKERVETYDEFMEQMQDLNEFQNEMNANNEYKPQIMEFNKKESSDIDDEYLRIMEELEIEDMMKFNEEMFHNEKLQIIAQPGATVIKPAPEILKSVLSANLRTLTRRSHCLERSEEN